MGSWKGHYKTNRSESSGFKIKVSSKEYYWLQKLRVYSQDSNERQSVTTRFRSWQACRKIEGTNSYSVSLKMNGTYFIFWSFLLYGVCSIGMTDGCPDHCSCCVITCKNVDCYGRGLKTFRRGYLMVHVICKSLSFLLYTYTKCITNDDNVNK